MLVLAAIVASFRGGNSFFRKPVAAGERQAIAAGVATWFGVIWLIGRFHGSESRDPGRNWAARSAGTAAGDELVLPQGLLDRPDLAPQQASPRPLVGRFGWLSLFNNWETFVGQFIALALVVGSYVAAQYVRVWRPRRHGQRSAQIAQEPPRAPVTARVATSQPG